MKKGDVVEGHKHHFDHTTIVFSGALHIKATMPDGTVREGDFEAPAPESVHPAHALIAAGVSHELTALRDGTIFWCVYSHRGPQGEVWQRYTGWEDAYN
jgi:quercetin dioxygenase-like cupin family protein